MWEQILKVYNVKVDRNSEDRAIATYEWATNTLTLALNKLMQDYNPEKIGLSIERGVENPTPISEFKLNDKIFIKNMEKNHPELPPLMMERYGVDEDTAKGILVSVNRIHNREIFEASPEIETE